MDHRSRLLEGMAKAVAAKGYADTTLADIVAAANVSRRTFYEHFTDKAECLLALFEASSNRLTEQVRQAIDLQADWQEQVKQSIEAYLTALEKYPQLLPILLTDIFSLGDCGLQVRRIGYERLSDLILEVAQHSATKSGRQTYMTRQMAMAVVGGINELVLAHIEQGQTASLRELQAPACSLLKAVILAER
jgi:AcrR family transcriptional regulator